MTNNDIEWHFENYQDLTTVTLKERYRVKMFYSYCLSVSDLQGTTLRSVDSVVNLHMWNDGPVSESAKTYARALGIETYNQNQFFAYCHRKLK